VQVAAPVAPGEGRGAEEPVQQEHPPDHVEREVQRVGGQVGEEHPDPPHGDQGDQEDVVGVARAAQASGVHEGNGERDLGEGDQP